MAKTNKKALSSEKKKIAGQRSRAHGFQLPGQQIKGVGDQKRKKDSGICYDFTSDHDINPPQEARKKK